MKIGIDLDGVVYDSETLLRAKAELRDLEMSGKGLIDPSSWHVRNRHGWTEKQDIEFDDQAFETLLKSPLIPYAKFVIKKLKKEGDEIIFITSRGERVPEEIKITKKVLRRDKLVFNKIVYCKDGKLKTCKELGIDVMIDDRPETIQELSKNGIKCFYYRSAELPKINRKNVSMVYNWGQIYRLIYNLKKEKRYE